MSYDFWHTSWPNCKVYASTHLNPNTSEPASLWLLWVLQWETILQITALLLSPALCLSGTEIQQTQNQMKQNQCWSKCVGEGCLIWNDKSTRRYGSKKFSLSPNPISLYLVPLSIKIRQTSQAHQQARRSLYAEYAECVGQQIPEGPPKIKVCKKIKNKNTLLN